MARWLDSIISGISPEWALRRAQARRALAYYEAARPTVQRKQRRESGSGDAAVLRAGKALREQARHLEQNHDIVRGALAILVANIAGPTGIQIEPQPRTLSGDIHDAFALQIQALWRDWAKRPDVTWQHDWASMQRLLARSWVRDGEVLVQIVGGTNPTLDHGTVVPLSLEMIEADLLPIDHSVNGPPRITAGVERNTWGRPTAYHVYKEHPGDLQTLAQASALKRVPAENILHIKMIDRIRQARGVSVFASVLGRLDDVKDYEESERIAAKVAASMAAVIKKGSPELYEQAIVDGEPVARDLRFRPGMIFDDLMPGESIETIDSKRPNPNVESFRSGQLRAAAAGIGTTYSSLARNYDGTYSAQRQELVEAWGAYGVLQSEFSGQFVRPVYERFLGLALQSRALRVPADIDPASLDDALYLGPQMPWIDPAKEAKAWETLEANGHASGPEIIRRRGQNPTDVLDQEARWRRRAKESGVLIALDPTNQQSAPNARLVRN